MAVNLAPGPFGVGGQFFSGNVPLNGGQILTYAAGTTTPQPTFTTSAGNIANSNPILLNANGILPQEVWLTAGIAYKFVVTDSVGNVIFPYTMDNLRGINDFSSLPTGTEWIDTGLTPTFVSTTSFSLPGDQTGNFQQNRRVKIIETAGTVYGTVTSSSVVASVTTVNVLLDSGAVVDNGISNVSYGILSPVNVSIPQYIKAGSNITISYVNGIPTIIGAGSTGSMTNGTIGTPTVASGTMTMPLKTQAGADPSPSDPVTFVFATATGGITLLQITAAASWSLPSGATLGTISAVAARIYLCATQNNAGTGIVLSVWNPVLGASPAQTLSGIIDDQPVAVVTPPANTAQVLYGPTAVTAGVTRVIGYVEFNQATAGTYATLPSKVQIWVPGMRRTGDVAQVQKNVVRTVMSGTGTIPYDNTIPQNTEGNQFFTITLTAKSSLNIFAHQMDANASASSGSNGTCAIFQDAGVNAIVASAQNFSGGSTQINFLYAAPPGTAASTTFNVRIGENNAGTCQLNGANSAGQVYGGVNVSSYQITEIVI